MNRDQFIYENKCRNTFTWSYCFTDPRLGLVQDLELAMPDNQNHKRRIYKQMSFLCEYREFSACVIFQAQKRLFWFSFWDLHVFRQISCYKNHMWRIFGNVCLVVLKLGVSQTCSSWGKTSECNNCLSLIKLLNDSGLRKHLLQALLAPFPVDSWVSY